MVEAIMSRPPDYYCMTYGDFEEEDAASSSQTSKDTSKVCIVRDTRRTFEDLHSRVSQRVPVTSSAITSATRWLAADQLARPTCYNDLFRF